MGSFGLHFDAPGLHFETILGHILAQIGIVFAPGLAQDEPIWPLKALLKALLVAPKGTKRPQGIAAWRAPRGPKGFLLVV